MRTFLFTRPRGNSLYFLHGELLCQGGEFRSLEAIKWVGHLTAWLRLSTLQTGIHSFDLDVFIVLQVPVILLANVFFYFKTRNPADVPTNCERLRVCAGIIDRGFIVHIVIIGTREAFDQVHLIGMQITAAIKPVSFI